MSDYLASMFSDKPVLVAPGQEGWLASCITTLQAKIDNVGAEQMKEWAKAGDKDWWGEAGSFKAMLRPYNVEDGTLTVNVRGMLMHNFPYAAFGLATGYDYIVKAFERGMEDPEVERIAMMVESGGGMVAGAFDATDKLYAMRGKKPMVGFANEFAYSAAFSLISAMDEIVLPRTGGVGSVGVVTSHVNKKAALDKAGLEVTFMYAGKHKVDGNPYEALGEDAKNRMQARIDALYNIFVSTVARNLGIEESAVRGTEALTLSADEAVAIGFATRIAPIDEAIAALGGSQAAGVETMSQATTQKPETQPSAGADQASLDAARAEGHKEGAQAERERIQGILGSEQAKDRAGLANHIAMNTDMTVEAATAILSASPAEVATAAATTEQPAASHFAAAMANGNPEIRPEATAEGNEGPQGEDLVASILGDYHAVAGKPAAKQ